MQEAQVSLGRGVASLLIVLVVGGCRRPDPDTLRVADRVPLPTSFASVLVLPDGSIWLGRPGELVRTDSVGSSRSQVVVPETAIPYAVAHLRDRAYFRAGPSIIVLDATGDSLLLLRGEMPGDPVAVDPRDRFVFRTGAAGAVMAHGTESLDPVWGWGAIGAAATALTVSPEGDRVYLAVAEEEGEGAELLVRDLQTGRILRRLELPGPAQILLAGPANTLYAASWREDDGGGDVLRLDWEGGSPQISWRRSFDDFGPAAPARLRLSNAGDRLAVLTTRNEDGLHVLDVETGRTVDRLRGVALDVAFDAGDRIVLLTGSELRWLQ
jgi:hypothetical protein